MHIINAMFAKGLGGIEQSFLDYCTALELQGDTVTAFIHRQAALRGRTIENVAAISNSGQWDPLAKFRLRRQLKRLKPDAVIAHGNRAVSLMRSAARGICPVIGVTHNYSLERMVKLDGVFVLTADLEKKMLELGYPKEQLFRIGNMVACDPERTVPSFPKEGSITIGTLGRFVPKKGFDVLVNALAGLKRTHPQFQAMIGGNGETEEALWTQVEQLKLTGNIRFTGWVEDKDAFFSGTDIFVLPSHHEPFGIVLLEAMARGLPIVSTDSEGPSELLTDGQNALIVPRGDTNAMADAIARLMDDPALAQKIGTAALATVRTKYDIEVLGAAIHNAVGTIVKQYDR